VKRLAIAAVALLILTVAALVIFADRGDHHQVDVKAWQAELRDHADNGLPHRTKTHWKEYQATIVRQCGESFETLGILLTARGDMVVDPELGIGFKYQCPDQLSKLENAYRSVPVPHAHDKMMQACEASPGARTEVQQELAVWCP